MSPVPNERRPSIPGDPAATDAGETIRSDHGREQSGKDSQRNPAGTTESLKSLSPADHLLKDDDVDKTSDSSPIVEVSSGTVKPADHDATRDSQAPQLSRLAEATFAPDLSDRSRPTRNSLEATLASQTKKTDSELIEIADTDTCDDDTPKNIGRYQVRRLLGEGAFGKVYEAHDPQLDRRVAIKVAKVISGDTQIKRFLREARAAAHLRHPNIIPVYEYGLLDGQNIIVYEFVAGETLRSFIKRRSKIELTETVEIIRLIAAGLDYAHEQGIIHRDMKPDNVLIDKFGHPHIADFGCARAVNDQTNLTMDGSILGTPMYMSPEQASGKSSLADGRTDIWSLGVMLYEMVSGTRPFRGKLTDLLFWICHNDARPLRQVNPSTPIDIETICCKCLTREPEKRFLTAGLLADELERFQRGEPILSRPIGPLRRTWLWAKRNQAVASLLATVAVTLMIATIVSTAFAIVAKREQWNRAMTQLNALKTSEASALPQIFADLAPFRKTVLPRLQEQLAMENADSDARHRIRMAILELEEDPANRQQLAELMIDDLLSSDAGDFLVCRNCLRFQGSDLSGKLWDVAQDSSSSNSGARRFRAAAALALYDPASPNWESVAADVTGYLTALNQIEMSHWLPSLEPIREILKPNLVKAYLGRNEQIDTTPVKSAAIISRMFTDQVEFLTDMVPAATPRQIPYLTGALSFNSTEAIPQLEQKLAAVESDGHTRSGDASETTNLIVSLIQLHEPNQWHQLISGPDSSVVTNLIERLGPSSTAVELLVEKIDQWQSLDPDILSGILLSLGQFRPNQILDSQKARMLPTLLSIFTDHDDARVHSSARWILHQWEFKKELEQREKQLRRTAPEPDKNWHVDLAGNTFALFGPVEAFEMGLDQEWVSQPDFDISKIYGESQHRKQIPRRFGICIHEVTIHQFEEFEVALMDRMNKRIRELQRQLIELESKTQANDDPVNAQVPLPDDAKRIARTKKQLELKVDNIQRVRNRRAALDKKLPIGDVDFWTSLAYCRWLSEMQGTECGIPSLDNLQTIYDKGSDYEFTQARLDLKGYRLPTSTEWEYACRGCSKTVFPFGRTSRFADRYAWFATNSNSKLHPVGQLKPGNGGVFDMLGNVSEWCLDWYKEQLPSIDEKLGRSYYVDHGPEFTQERTLDREFRGGSFQDEVGELRSTRRRGTRPMKGYPRLGFRLARTY